MISVKNSLYLATVIAVSFIHMHNNEFKQFIDVVEDYCGYMKGSVGNFVLGRLIPLILNLTSTNINHPCPWPAGKYYIKNSNLSAHWLAPQQFVPSGRYRLEMTWHEGFKGVVLAKAVGFGTVSDHRLERF
ncbi:hypothetical protein HA402_008825 [Bradysia odoriphaga]|nr:hypothetical protein HA402_008825 [Bradysia odoriphaga]